MWTAEPRVVSGWLIESRARTSRPTWSLSAFLQALLPLLPIRHVGEQETLEELPVVGRQEMHQLVNDNVLGQFLGDFEQVRVERQPPFLGHRPPLRAHRAQVNLRRLDADSRGPMPRRPAEV